VGRERKEREGKEKKKGEEKSEAILYCEIGNNKLSSFFFFSFFLPTSISLSLDFTGKLDHIVICHSKDVKGDTHHTFIDVTVEVHLILECLVKQSTQ
jgi:hypothetical protein